MPPARSTRGKRGLEGEGEGAAEGEGAGAADRRGVAAADALGPHACKEDAALRLEAERQVGRLSSQRVKERFHRRHTVRVRARLTWRAVRRHDSARVYRCPHLRIHRSGGGAGIGGRGRIGDVGIGDRG